MQLRLAIFLVRRTHRLYLPPPFSLGWWLPTCARPCVFELEPDPSATAAMLCCSHSHPRRVQEMKWGTKTFLQLYFMSGVFSSLYSAVCIPELIGVGASGALMGIMVCVCVCVSPCAFLSLSLARACVCLCTYVPGPVVASCVCVCVCVCVRACVRSVAQGAWLVDILVEWGEGNSQTQQQRSFQLVMCVVNMMVILGFSFVRFPRSNRKHTPSHSHLSARTHTHTHTHTHTFSVSLSHIHSHSLSLTYFLHLLIYSLTHALSR